MVKTEYLNDGTLIRHYSDDKTKKLLQNETGVEYDEAIDAVPCEYTYSEIDKPIDELENLEEDNEVESSESDIPSEVDGE